MYMYFKLRGLIVQRKSFITTFGSQKRATGFHWRAKHFELNLSTKWPNQDGKIILTGSQFPQCPAFSGKELHIYKEKQKKDLIYKTTTQHSTDLSAQRYNFPQKYISWD